MHELNKDIYSERFEELYKAFQKTSIDQELQIISAQNGLPSLRFELAERKKLINSKYDPMQEAINFINALELNTKTIPIIVGFELGYHTKALLKRFSDFERIFIIEPRLDVLKLAFEKIDLSEILSNKSVSFISSLNSDYLINALSQLVNNPHYKRRLKLIVHTPSLELYCESHPGFADIIQRMNVDPKMQKIMHDNFGKNIGLTLRSPGISRFFNKFTQRPIMLISAGPSLNQDIETIKTIKDKCIIISVTTCLKLLLANGITPDFISIGDPKQIMETHFEGLFELDIPLIFLPTVSSSLLRKYQGPKIAALQNDYKLCDIIEKKVFKGRVDVGESVATLNLDASIKFGGDPIIFVGQDLAFSDGHSHASGVDKRLSITHKSKEVENVQNKMVPTSMSLMWFKDWIEKRINKDPSRTYINVSKSGARIKGTIEMSLEEAARKYAKEKIDKTFIDELLR